jgi:hypothetical protein
MTVPRLGGFIMNRGLIGCGAMAVVLGLGLAGAKLCRIETVFVADTHSSFAELVSRHEELAGLDMRIQTRIALKKELIDDWVSGSLDADEMIDHWTWLNNLKPLYTSALENYYPGMSARQVAMCQILVSIEPYQARAFPADRFDEAVVSNAIALESVISARTSE